MSVSFLWDDRDNFPTQNKWNLINQYTKELLSKSDWTHISDNGLSFLKRLEWQTYRDALRSIQDDFTNPDDVILPEEPAEE